MIVALNPTSLAIIVLQLVALALVGWACTIALRVVLGWNPGRHTRRQLELERRVEVGFIALRWGWWLLLASGVLTIVHVAGILPQIVPGAMCGTGVVQAAGPDGQRTLVMLPLAVAVLGATRIVEGLNGRSRTGELTVLTSRLLLVCTPVLALAVWAVVKMLVSLDASETVDCCAALYDAAAGGAGGAPGFMTGTMWSAILGVATVATLGIASMALWRPRSRVAKIALALVSPLWVLAAYGALIHLLAAYHYEVLHHHCPWCLLLLEHGLVGYPLFCSMAVVGLRGPAALVADLAIGSHPDLSDDATKQARVSAVAVLIAVAVYLLFAVVPALAWRVEFGTWM